MDRSWAEGAIQALLERLASTALIDLLRKQRVEDGLVEKFKTTLLSLDAVLNDAQEKQVNNPRVGKWLREFTDNVYRTEDILDKISTEALLNRLTKSRVRNLKWEIETTMEQINEMMDAFLTRSNELGLTGGIGYDTKLPPRIPAASPVDDSERVFGRESDTEAIIDLLLSASASADLSLIRIVAEDGMGKTTLARLVYENHKVCKHFNFKGWAWVPEEGKMSSFKAYDAIFKSFTSDDLENMKYLIVLDDISSTKLDYRHFLFHSTAKGSCIIVTTADPEVLTPDKLPGESLYLTTYYMNPLPYEECWSIFANFAFGNEKPSSYPKLEDIGKQIVKACHGKPLTVRVLGTFLRSKVQVEEWDEVLHRMKHFYFSEEMTDIGLALRMSYDQLPAHLKRCLSYCSIFPQGYEFEKEKLVYLWMAEGLLPQPKGNQRIEEVGDYCFHELLLRSFFKQSSVNKSHFVMQSLTYDLAGFVSGGFCLRVEEDYNDDDSDDDDFFRSNPMFIRYLSIFECNSSKTFECIRKAKLLRTCLVQDSSWSSSSNLLKSVLSKLKFLRVLSLSHNEVTMLPDSISDLRHLRYIDLSHTKIENLPEQVCFLPNLQTLILSNCHSLTELPQNMGKLINLRHLHIGGTNLNEMPKNMSRLESIQTLSNFVVGKESGSTVTELGGLFYLHGTLCISNLQNIVSAKDVAEVNLLEKTHLDELVLEWGDATVDPENDRDVLEQLVPHTNLKKLSISFYSGTRFPHWLGDFSFSNIFFLHLSNCKNCLDLPPLGQLPSLKVLIIESMNAVKQVGLEFCGTDKPFQSLETLTFEGMLEWEEWISFEVEGGEFPCLRELCIQSCPKLKGNLPKQLPSVVRVEISESQHLVTTLTTEASLHKGVLHYHDKVMFISGKKALSQKLSGKKADPFSDQMTFFKHEGATESSLPMSQGVAESSLPMNSVEPSLLMPTIVTIQGATESLLTMTQGATEPTRGTTAEKCSLPTKGAAATESSLPMNSELLSTTQGATEPAQGTTTAVCSLPTNSAAATELSLLMNFEVLSMTQGAPEPTQGTTTAVCSLPTNSGAATESSLPMNPAISSLHMSMTQDAIESSLTTTQGATESSLPMNSAVSLLSLSTTQDATEFSSSTTQGATEPTQGTTTVECSLPTKAAAAIESSLPTTQTLNIRDEADVPTNTQSNHDGLQDLSSFKSLKVSKISQLRKLPVGLHSLKIEGCDALEFIPEQVMTSNPPIQHLYIISCCSLKSFPGCHPPTALKFLYIQNCKKLKFLPSAEKMHQYALLENLCIGSSCDSLEFLPLDFFPKLRNLSIWDCEMLKSLSMPEGFQKDLTSLEALEIRDCPNLLSFPKGGLPAPNLKSIWFSNCKNLKELPDQLHTLNSLRSMFINNCPELVSLSEGGLPSNLCLLCITLCDKLVLRMEWGLHRLDNLSRLEIEGGCKNVVSFPEAKLLPSNLNSLRISRLLNLKYLDYKGLQHLTALKILEISYCNKLQSLPEEGLPSSLSFLCIKECSLLKPKLQNKTGKDWSKIAHISCIETDEEVSHEQVWKSLV